MEGGYAVVREGTSIALVDIDRLAALDKDESAIIS